MGAYYTKEDITEYIGKSTVLPFLFDAARSKCRIAFERDEKVSPSNPTVWDLLKRDPDRYIYPAVRHGLSWDIHAEGGRGVPLDQPRPLPADIEAGRDATKPNLTARRKGWNREAPAELGLPTEIWREVVARRERCEALRTKLKSGEVRDINDLITLNLDLRQFAEDVIEGTDSPDLLRAFWHAIERLTVLDPTCGSGAFLFAALNILEPLYEACLDRMEAFLRDEAARVEPGKLKQTAHGLGTGDCGVKEWARLRPNAEHEQLNFGLVRTSEWNGGTSGLVRFLRGHHHIPPLGLKVCGSTLNEWCPGTKLLAPPLRDPEAIRVAAQVAEAVSGNFDLLSQLASRKNQHHPREDFSSDLVRKLVAETISLPVFGSFVAQKGAQMVLNFDILALNKAALEKAA